MGITKSDDEILKEVAMDEEETSEEDLVEAAMDQGLKPSVGETLSNIKNEVAAPPVDLSEVDLEEDLDIDLPPDDLDEEPEEIVEPEEADVNMPPDVKIGDKVSVFFIDEETEKETLEQGTIFACNVEDDIYRIEFADGVTKDFNLDDLVIGDATNKPDEVIPETQLEKDIKQDVEVEKIVEKEEAETEPVPEQSLEGVTSSVKQINTEPVPMDIIDYQKLSQVVNELHKRLGELGAEAKGIKDKITGVTAEISSKMRDLASQTTLKSVNTWWIYNWDTDRKTYQAEYNGEVINLKEINIDQQDRQLTLASLTNMAKKKAVMELEAKGKAEIEEVKK